MYLRARPTPESAEGKVASEWLGGTYEEKPETWIEASALPHIDKNTPPTLFINSSLPRFHAGRNDMFKKFDSIGYIPKFVPFRIRLFLSVCLGV